MRSNLRYVAAGVVVGFALGLIGYRSWERHWPLPHIIQSREFPATEATAPAGSAALQTDPNFDLRAELRLLRRQLSSHVTAHRSLDEPRDTAGSLPEGEPADGPRRSTTIADWSMESASTTSEALTPAAAQDRIPTKAAQPRFDEASLVAYAVDPEEARWLRARFEETELERLYLRDDAIRGGYWKKPRYKLQVLALEHGLRTELGDASYDLVLYASGRNNRVIIKDVLMGSPAERSGILAGDVLRRYDDATIFTGWELRRATTRGDPGAAVPLDLLRNGEEIRVYVPRGPLGTGLLAQRHPPDLLPPTR